MNARRRKTQSQKIQEKYLKIRDELWPDLDDDMLWDRRLKAGFTTIPRTMPHLLQLMDQMSGGKRVSPTYLTLWCRLYDESMVVLDNEAKAAFESGFTGQRAVITWRSRMKQLVELNFIDVRPGASGAYNYVLIWNPYKVIKMHCDSGLLPKDIYYNALFERAVEIGAERDL